MSSLPYYNPITATQPIGSRMTLVLATALLGISVASSSLYLVLGGSLREAATYLAIYGLISVFVTGLAWWRRRLLKNADGASIRMLIALRVTCASLSLPCVLLFAAYAYGVIALARFAGSLPPLHTIRAGGPIVALVAQGILFWGLAAGTLIFMAVKRNVPPVLDEQSQIQ
jgi:hypothetical protein